MQPQEITWETLEYKRKEKSTDWFWALGIICVSLAIVSFLFRNILFGFFIILGGFTLALYAYRPPQKVKVCLSSREVRVGNKRVGYRDIDSFWIEDRDGNARLLFKEKNLLSPFVIVPIEGVASDTIRNFLLEYMPEEEHEEPISQKLLEYLGF